LVLPARGLGRGWLLLLTLFGLVAMVFATSPADAAHPSLALLEGSEDSDSSSAERLPTEAPPPATPATAVLVCLTLLALPVVLVTRRTRRAGIVVAAALLGWFAGESALHAAHHLGDRAGAERCPAFAASHHVSGLDPLSAVPVLGPPGSTAAAPLVPSVAWAPVVPHGAPARAPPRLPA
jgi:hypothetical protein